MNIGQTVNTTDGKTTQDIISRSARHHEVMAIIERKAMDEQIETLDEETEAQIEIALSELQNVQFLDNTWTQAIDARDEVIQIIRDLAKRLTRQGEEKITCEFRDCMNEAEYEGWFSVLDFSGQKTGLIRKMYVCKDCKKFLIGSE